jgi:periplasmic protein TonB
MKRKNEQVPGFDEIIFENRNKDYGAYDLRRSYFPTLSISIIGGAVLIVLITVAFSFTTKDGKAPVEQKFVSLVISDPLIPNVSKPEPKPPEALAAAAKNLRPEVVTDTSLASSFVPITEEIIDNTINGNPLDTHVFVDVTDPGLPVPDEPFISVQEMPQFPGGIPALMKFINESIVYPEIARNNNIQGRVVLKFVVNGDGTVNRIIIISGIDPSLDNEAVRVVGKLPRFKPGKQGGVPVPVWFTLPVRFRLETN